MGQQIPQQSESGAATQRLLSPWSTVPEDRKYRSDLLAPLTPETEPAPHSKFLLCVSYGSPRELLLSSLVPSWPVSIREPQDSEGSKAASMAKLAVLLLILAASMATWR